MVKSFRESNTSERIRLGILVLLSLITVAIFVFYFFTSLSWRQTSFMGVMLSPSMTVNGAQPNTGETWAGLNAGLRTGDQLLAINGEDIANYRSVLSELSTGDEVTITYFPVDDNAVPDNAICTTEGECSIVVRLQSIPDSDFLALFVTPFTSGIIVLGIALLLMRLRPWEPRAFVIITACLLMAIYMAGIFDVGSTHRLVPFWYVNGAFLGGMILTVGLIFPTTLPIVRRQPLLRFVPTVFSALLAGYILATYRNEAPAALGESAQAIAILIIMALAILAILLFFYQRPLATSDLFRFQANIGFLGVALAMVPAIFWLARQVAQALGSDPILAFPIEAAMPFYITPTLAMAYSVLQYHHIDSDRLISQAITYSIMFIALVASYFLLVLGFSLFTTRVVDTRDPLIIVLLIFGISLFFAPVRGFLQSRVDQVYFRTRHNYQSYQESFRRDLTSLSDLNAIITRFREVLNQTVQPINTLIFLFDPRINSYTAHSAETDITFGPESGIIKLLKNQDITIYLEDNRNWPVELQVERQRLNILKSMMIAGMAGRDRLTGFVTVGPPRSGANAYTFEELRFINNIVLQLAIAVERTQVVSSLESRVRELDVLSQVGQAVNFAIEFDDLLELISAQTLRLIEAPYFYIVLRDTALNQLYFAFFQEDDERISDKENKKWSMGHDLYSEIVQKSQPIILDNYARTVEERNYKLVFGRPDTNAWMGFPLISGPNTLGVLAIGTSDPTARYSSEQIKIFGNISALAATSIEKARLFTETNTRARQLEALNDVSRQLGATEGDVERLLDLITTSAVEILNAEAGSLLMVVDDNSREMEFMAAVGGTGYRLIGQRLPQGQGIVGRVAETGQPIISNDTSSDERWEGEITEDFHTNSVLAVPLITKNNVIGVLEVINKKDGSIYIEDDAELLMTFAGQAAIAYENARLLQQTGLEFRKRLRELEALELIDKELNKTLDLYNVARITVRWAIANSGASAGLLGVMSDDRTRLQIIHRYGYDEEDMPEGAEGDMWPVDRGIVKRVLRTHRPELQPDVSIDPDYVPSLQKALSQITVPMLSGDEVNAILILETSREPRLNLLDLDWVQRLAEHASIAIANAQLYQELTRANETKSEFMGFAAHELKNPLASVKGYADLLRSGMPGEVNSQQKDFLNIIRTNSDRMQTIIDDLRDIAKIDADQLKVSLSPIDIRTVVTDTLQTYQKNLEEKQQEVVIEIDETAPPILGDRVRLVQILTNLISNAHKYSPPGSTVIVGATVEDNHRNHKGKLMGAAMRVYVQDNGIGMSEEDLQRIFRVRYFRSDNKAAQDQPGTGLGMMITQHLIQQHGGTIWVESKLGKGSTFHFTVPVAAEAEEKQETPSHETETEPASD